MTGIGIHDLWYRAAEVSGGLMVIKSYLYSFIVPRPSAKQETVCSAVAVGRVVGPGGEAGWITQAKATNGAERPISVATVASA